MLLKIEKFVNKGSNSNLNPYPGNLANLETTALSAY